MLSLLQLFEKLGRGEAPAKSNIGAKYPKKIIDLMYKAPIALLKAMLDVGVLVSWKNSIQVIGNSAAEYLLSSSARSTTDHERTRMFSGN